MWTKKTLTSIGSVNLGQNAMLETLRDYLVNNTLVPFEVVSDTINNSSTNANERKIELKHNNIKLQFSYSGLNINTQLSCTSYLILPDNTSLNLSTFTIADYIGNSTIDNILSYNRSLSILIIKNNDSFVIRFVPQNDKYASTNGKHIANIACNVVDDTLGYSDDIVLFVVYNNTNKLIKRLREDNACNFAVGHTALKNNKLVLENKLSVTNNGGYFIEETSDAVGLIGAEMHKFYQTENDTYFCFNTDMAMRMGEEVTSDVT